MHDIMHNGFKQALAEGRSQIGLWLGLADPYAAEVVAGAGYDWLLIDGEHAPNTLSTMLAQLQALAPYAGHAVVRVAWNDAVRIKQVLDIGAQTLLVPMIENAEQARAALAAMHYPPRGVRGVGAALARASRWNRLPDYLQRANDGICALLQVETRAGLAALDDILAVPGVDGVFIGPSDLAADFGALGQPGREDVQVAIEKALKRIAAAGKAPGILSSDAASARRYMAWGSRFTAVGVDVTLLARGAETLLAQFRDASGSDAPDHAGGAVY